MPSAVPSNGSVTRRLSIFSSIRLLLGSPIDQVATLAFCDWPSHAWVTVGPGLSSSLLARTIALRSKPRSLSLLKARTKLRPSEWSDSISSSYGADEIPRRDHSKQKQRALGIPRALFLCGSPYPALFPWDLSSSLFIFFRGYLLQGLSMGMGRLSLGRNARQLRTLRQRR